MNKFIEISEHYQKYMLDHKDDDQIVDVKLFNGKSLARRNVKDFKYLELKPTDDILSTDVKYISLSRKYKSREVYSKKYNSTLSTIQIDRELHVQLKEFLLKDKLNIRQWIEDIIKREIS